MLESDVLERLKNPTTVHPDEAIGMLNAFFERHRLSDLSHREFIMKRICEIVNSTDCLFGLRAFMAMSESDMSVFPDEAMAVVVDGSIGALQTRSELAVTTLERVAKTRTAVMVAKFDVAFWCSMIRATRERVMITGMLRIVLAYMKFGKKMGLPVDQGMVQDIIAAFRHQMEVGEDMETMKVVFDCLWVLSEVYIPWITTLERSGMLVLIAKGLTVRSATIKSRTLMMMTKMYKNGTRAPQFNIGEAIPLMEHRNYSIQNAAIDCVTAYIQARPGTLSGLVEEGVIDVLMNVIREGAYGAKHHAVCMCMCMMNMEAQVIPVFVEKGLIESILMLLEQGGMTGDMYGRYMTVLKQMKRYFVNAGEARAFWSIVIENNGLDIMEIVYQNTDKLKAEDADIFIREMQAFAS